jgi:selenium metabolism protein YedF
MTDPARPAETVVILNADTLGRGDEALGAKLTGAFLRTLVALEEKPAALILYNGAVRLLSPESTHLEALRALDDAGVDLLACVTCLEHFALTERMALGRVSNMREIVQRSLAAAKVISL